MSTAHLLNAGLNSIAKSLDKLAEAAKIAADAYAKSVADKNRPQDRR